MKLLIMTLLVIVTFVVFDVVVIRATLRIRAERKQIERETAKMNREWENRNQRLAGTDSKASPDSIKGDSSAK